ncbi:MAG: class I SAM-dependent methyltransferase [Verrucomicrobiota bacterium]
MKIRYETLLPVYHLIWRHWRERRREHFRIRMNPDPAEVVLDVGGCPSEWTGRGAVVGTVDLINLEISTIIQRPDSPVMRSFKGDGRALEFEDGSYDIVYSNSVLEHVGTWEDQQAFAREARRVGGNLWIQTPAYGCPVEPHYLGLFIHWFPAHWHVPLARWTSVVGLTGAADLHSIANNTRLLTKREFKELFPDCEIWTERLFLIFPKSYVAIRTGSKNSTHLTNP